MSPQIAGFEDHKKAVAVGPAFAGIVLGYSLFTKAKLGVVKVISYKTHASLDLISGIAALAVSQTNAIKENRPATNTFNLMGVVGITVRILSSIGARHH